MVNAAQTVVTRVVAEASSASLPTWAAITVSMVEAGMAVIMVAT